MITICKHCGEDCTLDYIQVSHLKAILPLHWYKYKYTVQSVHCFCSPECLAGYLAIRDVIARLPCLLPPEYLLLHLSRQPPKQEQQHIEIDLTTLDEDA